MLAHRTAASACGSYCRGSRCCQWEQSAAHLHGKHPLNNLMNHTIQQTIFLSLQVVTGSSSTVCPWFGIPSQTTTNYSHVCSNVYSRLSQNTHKLTTHEVVQLDVGKGFDFCFTLKLGSVTEKHGLQEKSSAQFIAMAEIHLLIDLRFQRTVQEPSVLTCMLSASLS